MIGYKSKAMSFVILITIGMTLFFCACNDTGKKGPASKVIVDNPEELDKAAKEYIKDELAFAKDNKGLMSDSARLNAFNMVQKSYNDNHFETIWSDKDQWKPAAGEMYKVMERAMEYGLFPSDYNFKILSGYRDELQKNPDARKNAALWAKADILFTSAWLAMAKDLKQGRLLHDSTSLRNDSLITNDYYCSAFKQAVDANNVRQSLESMEPSLEGYKALRDALPAFLNSSDFKDFTVLTYPTKDSLAFIKKLETRLQEGGYLQQLPPANDTLQLKSAIEAYQKDKKLKVTGRVSETLVKSLNYSDWQKFKQIAINLDRYKQLPDTLPATYAWVNLPAFMLSIYDGGILDFKSRIICGSPRTRTPLLTSNITNFITYPQWTVPYSIVFKEMLPKIQKNVGYLDKQNLMVVDRNDSVIDPHTVDWSKLDKTHFPYLLRQREGDDNSLGVMKFNFVNKYSVYLHDTNNRGLFGRDFRALSHGCVRVQEWEKLYKFLLRNDTLGARQDSVNAWMTRQEKRTVSGFPRLPLYIRYFTCDVVDGQIKFYDDIYGEDKKLMEKIYVARKQ